LSEAGRRVEGCLFDIDGTVIEDEAVIPGAAEALDALRRAEIPFRFATNITRFSRSTLAGLLTSRGVPVRAEEILSAPSVAALWLREQGSRRVQLLLQRSTWEEFEGFEIGGSPVQHVLVGDLGAEWSFEILNEAFRNLLDGAELVAVHRNRYWWTGGKPTLDAGAFVASLEYSSGRTATLIGKPSPAFFEVAARELGLPPGRIAMVGDDLENDVQGPRQAGIAGVLVRTGRGRETDEALARRTADAVLDSVADLPGWLGIA
jgi:HAD superfamily hydrolase (TIGR01458 family)